MSLGLHHVRFAWVLLAVSGIVVAACSSPAGTQPAGQTVSEGGADDGPLSPPPDGPASDGRAGSDDASGDAPACVLKSLPILVDSLQETYNVPVTEDGKSAALLIDTGAPNTYVWLPLPEAGAGEAGAADDAGLGPDEGIAPADAGCGMEPDCVPDAGNVTLGCESLELPGYPQSPLEPVAGRPVVGTIGDETILAQPAWLDLVGNQLVFHAPGDPFTQAASWPATGMTRPYGYVRVEDVSFDGKPVKLLLDTGSPDCLWLGEEPAEGDVEIMGIDAIGQPVVMYISQVTVSIGAWSQTVQVFKVPSFPYFQPLATAAGVQGLFGVSAFPHGVVFDTDAMKVRVAP
ncbi:MAG TPA: hypothetical protein VF765_09585 [Polyangiaceae bacterium]